MSPTFGSLFAGVGGFDLGFEAAGWEPTWQVEWDARCQSVLARHWPEVPRYGDVSTVSGLEPVDCITYGFPCQDLSVAGRRAGLDGDRSGLFFHAVRIIKEMRDATGGKYPTWAIAENVPGLLNADGGDAMGRCLDALADIGAVGIEWAVLDAQHFGVPQRRRRVFLVAWFDPRISGRGSVLPFGESCGGDSATSKSSGSANASATRSGVTADCDGGRRNAFVKVVRSGARDSNGELPPEVWRSEQVGPTLNAFDNGTESRATILAIEDVGRKMSGGAEVGIGVSDGPMYTLQSSARHAVFNGGVRRLTPRECERLMGWPDDHTRWAADGREIADSNRYKMCGNGVVAPVAEWIAKRLMEAAT